MSVALDLLLPLVAAGASFVGSYAALRVHLDYLRRDVNEARDSSRRALADAAAAHSRLDRINAPSSISH